MASCTVGKPEVVRWIRDNFDQETSAVLDVGACDGLWHGLLPEYTMDAVEAFLPNAKGLRGYREVFATDIRQFKYGWYDLIIFGDVIEHLPVKDAQAVLAYAFNRCRDMVVAVPFLWPQGELYGNKYEIHVQPDLTADRVAERYPQLAVLHDCSGWNYCYYHKKGEEQ